MTSFEACRGRESDGFFNHCLNSNILFRTIRDSGLPSGLQLLTQLLAWKTVSPTEVSVCYAIYTSHRSQVTRLRQNRGGLMKGQVKE